MVGALPRFSDIRYGEKHKEVRDFLQKSLHLIRRSPASLYPARDSNPDAELSEVAHATDPKRADQRARKRSLVNLLIKSP